MASGKNFVLLISFLVLAVILIGGYFFIKRGDYQTPKVIDTKSKEEVEAELRAFKADPSSDKTREQIKSELSSFKASSGSSGPNAAQVLEDLQNSKTE